MQQRSADGCAKADSKPNAPSNNPRRHHNLSTDDELLDKLRLALHSSVAIAAAFTRDPRLMDDDRYSDPSDPSSDEDDYNNSNGVTSDTASSYTSSSSTSSSGSGSAGGNRSSSPSMWSTPLLEWGSSLWGPRRRARLVGFARAAGDYSLVATVHDVAIHPDLRGLGVGARLMKKIVTQVNQAEVGDVGLVAPSEVRPFFRGCSFDLDREESVPMVLGGLSGGGTAEVRRVAANEDLRRLLQQKDV